MVEALFYKLEVSGLLAAGVQVPHGAHHSRSVYHCDEVLMGC